MKEENGNTESNNQRQSAVKISKKSVDNQSIGNGINYLFRNEFLNTNLATPVSTTKKAITSKNLDNPLNKSNFYSKSLINSSMSKNGPEPIELKENPENVSASKPKPSYLKIKTITEYKKNNYAKSAKNLLNKSNTEGEMNGERLYRRGMALISQKNIRIEETKVKQKKEMNKTYTFTPVINKNSAHLSSKNLYRDRDASFTRANFSYDQTLDKRLNHSKISKRKTDNSFFGSEKKNLGITSNFENNVSRDRDLTNLGLHTSASNDNFQVSSLKTRKMTKDEINMSTSKLYSDNEKYTFKKELLRQEHYSKVCPFSPKIHNKEKPKVENFYFRLQDWIEKRNKNTKRKNNEESFDRKTGQRLFSPKLVSNSGKKGQIGVINEIDKKFNDMYEVAKAQEKKKKNKAEVQTKQFKDTANFKKITAKSTEYNEKIKHSVFKKIFDLLDTNKRNKIHGSTIDMDILPEKIKKILEPLIQELKEQDETLTGEEFSLACEHLFKVMPLSDKNIIYDYYFSKNDRNASKEKYQKQNALIFTFKPKINNYNPSDKFLNASLLKTAFTPRQQHSEDN